MSCFKYSFLRNTHDSLILCVCACVCMRTCTHTPAELWSVAHLAPLSMGFTRQEYWSGLPFPPPGDLPNPGIKPTYPVLAVGFFTTELPGKPK